MQKYIYQEQGPWLKQLCDQFIQKRFSKLGISSKQFYKNVKKKEFKLEEYCIRLPKIFFIKKV